MGKRNLRRWAESKARRSEPPRGHWSGGLFVEAPEFGTPTAPTEFLPVGPVPEAIGSVLSNILGGGPGAPGVHTHTFSVPRTEYDEDGEPIPQPPQPTMTVTRMPDREQGAA